MRDLKDNLMCIGLFAAGGAAGFLVGVLMAPASGEETRRRLGRRLEDEKEELLRRGKRVVEHATERIEERIGEGKRKLNDALHR